MGSIRFSLGRFNTEEEIDSVVAEVDKVISELKRLG
jgi:cysteine sulfinate desulfinase/cysteine desulfurase-like protein